MSFRGSCDGNAQQVYVIPQDAVDHGTFPDDTYVAPLNRYRNFYYTNDHRPFVIEKEEKENVTIYNQRERIVRSTNPQITHIARSSHSNYPFFERELVQMNQPSNIMLSDNNHDRLGNNTYNYKVNGGKYYVPSETTAGSSEITMATPHCSIFPSHVDSNTTFIDETNSSLFRTYSTTPIKFPISTVYARHNKVVQKVDNILIKSDGSRMNFSSNIMRPGITTYNNDTTTPIVEVLASESSTYLSSSDLALDNLNRQNVFYNINENNFKQNTVPQIGINGLNPMGHYSLAYDQYNNFAETLPNDHNIKYEDISHPNQNIYDGSSSLSYPKSKSSINYVDETLHCGARFEYVENSSNIMDADSLSEEIQQKASETSEQFEEKTNSEYTYNNISESTNKIKSPYPKYLHKINRNLVKKTKIYKNISQSFQKSLRNFGKVPSCCTSEAEEVISRKSIQLTNNKKIHIIRVNGKLSKEQILNIVKNCNGNSDTLNVDEFCNNLNTYQMADPVDNILSSSNCFSKDDDINIHISSKSDDRYNAENICFTGKMRSEEKIYGNNGHDTTSEKLKCEIKSGNEYPNTNSRIKNCTTENTEGSNTSIANETLREQVTNLIMTISADMGAHDLAKWNAKHIYSAYEEINGIRESTPKHVIAACLYFGGIVSGQPILVSERVRRQYDFKTFLPKIHTIISASRPEIAIDLSPSAYAPLLIKLCEIDDEYTASSIHQVLSFVNKNECDSPGLSQQWAIAALLTAVKMAKKWDYKEYVNKVKAYFRTQTLITSYQKILRKNMKN